MFVKHYCLGLLLTGLVVSVAASVEAAAPPKLSCPTRAPSEWNAGDAPLDQVQVLATPENEPIDESAPPSLVPDRNVIRNGTLVQDWQMNANGPGWRWYVDCRYRGIDRVLRLDARGLVHCRRTITHYRAASTDARRSEQQMICD